MTITGKKRIRLSPSSQNIFYYFFIFCFKGLSFKTQFKSFNGQNLSSLKKVIFDGPLLCCHVLYWVIRFQIILISHNHFLRANFSIISPTKNYFSLLPENALNHYPGLGYSSVWPGDLKWANQGPMRAGSVIEKMYQH